MTRASVWLSALALLAGCGDRPTEIALEPDVPPPIILIVIDALRADYLGTYGFEGPVSPNLDALAKESVVFERCSSQAPWTTASMASMMTSLYPEAHGVRLAPDDPRDQQSWRDRWTRAIPESTTTLAECLRDRGYRTAAFIANPFLARGLGFEQGFDTFDETAATNRNRDSSSLLDAGLEWLRSQTADDEPTFLYLHLMDVHGPYTAPDSDFAAVRDSPGFGEPMTLPDWGFRRIQPYLRGPRWAKGRERDQLRTWRGRYAAGIHAADRRIGEFIQELRNDGLWDQQLVVVTSDHGEELFDHGGWDHGFSLHEHQLHVPFMVRFPGDREAGGRVEDLVRLVDLMPTLIELTGSSGPPDMIGGDFRSLLDHSAKRWEPRVAFATSDKRHPGDSSIFNGRYKLIADMTAKRFKLYDIENDPGESNEISADNPAIVQSLVLRLIEEVAKIEQGTNSADSQGEIPSDQLERLQELGYLQ